MKDPEKKPDTKADDATSQDSSESTEIQDTNETDQEALAASEKKVMPSLTSENSIDMALASEKKVMPS